MKTSLALGPRRPLSRQTAWGYFTSNLALPGSGSLLAGRLSGYPQLALALGGLALTLIFGTRFAVWALVNLRRLTQPQDDPVAVLLEVWLGMRWALLGMVAFALGWLWALVTGWFIVQRAATETPDGKTTGHQQQKPTASGD